MKKTLMKKFQLNDLDITYQDIGSGTPVILAHCSSASHKAWSSLTKDFQKDHRDENYRVIAADFIGYGKSSVWPEEKNFEPLADVNLLLELFEIAGEPFHLVGHSYGGAMALQAARLKPEMIKSLTLIEPVAFHLLKLTGKDKEWNMITDLSKKVLSAYKSGNKEKAARIFTTYWIGNTRWYLMPKKMKQQIIKTINKVVKEFSILNAMDIPLSEYAQSEIPTRLIMGANTPKPTHTIMELLKEFLSDSNLNIINGAGHMCPLTHPEKVNPVIIEHIKLYN